MIARSILPVLRRYGLTMVLCWAIAMNGFGDCGDMAFEEIAPSVFVHQGPHVAATPANQGATANVAFIIGSRCVAVIDTGGSFAEGTTMHAAIRKRTALPICFVVNTHVHPDHVFGNAAFAADHPQFVGHWRLAAAVEARRTYYAALLQRTIGPAQALPSLSIVPTLAVRQTQTIDLGDRALVLQAWPVAHTDNDLTVYDPASGSLWLGDLVFEGHVPVVDGKVNGWLAVMTSLRALPAVRVVPGHGAVSTNWPAIMQPQQRYLEALRTEVRAALQAGRTLQQATAQTDLSERGNWKLFDDFHVRNVTAAYTELEWEE